MICAVIFSDNQSCVDGWEVADILLLFKTFCWKKGEDAFIRAGAFNRNNMVDLPKFYMYTPPLSTENYMTPPPIGPTQNHIINGQVPVCLPL